MVDIYQQALTGQKGSTNSLVNAALSAGNYQPFAGGTPTLGSKQLDETIRSNDMDNTYRNKALAETVRSNTLDSQYKRDMLNETIRSNSMSGDYQNRSLAAQIAAANAKNSGDNTNQIMAAAMGGVTTALGQGLSPRQRDSPKRRRARGAASPRSTS